MLKRFALGGLLPLAAHMGASPKGYAAGVTTYVNPLDVLIADPYALYHDEVYYLYGTSSPWGFKVWSSPDLVNWRYRGMAFNATPSSWGKNRFWSPEVIAKNGVFYMFYSAGGSPNDLMRICAASATSPLGPFKDIATPLFDDGKAWIDAHVFTDTDGVSYLYCAQDISYPPDTKSEIYVARLRSDMKALDTTPTLCITPSAPWEFPGGGVNGWNEGPFVFKHNGVYYMTYSGDVYSNPGYSVGYATATSPFGPWKKYSGNPILKKNAFVSGPGHNSIVRSPDGSELFIVYHTHQQASGGDDRQLAIDRLAFTADGAGGPDMLSVPGGPSYGLMNYPSGDSPFPFGTSDNFNSTTLDRTRWIIFNEESGYWRLANGQLSITTQEGDIYSSRADASNIFLQYAPPGGFSATVKVSFVPQANYEQAFLILWQDHKNYARFSTLCADGLKFEIIRETNATPVTFQTPNSIGSPVYLRIDCGGSVMRFHASPDGSRWTQIGPDYPLTLLEVKIGLGAIAPDSGAAREALFDDFRITPSAPSRVDEWIHSGRDNIRLGVNIYGEPMKLVKQDG
ncbi:MAG: family 43 glycosylhydrolase [bacterium]